MNVLITRAEEQSVETAELFTQRGLKAFVLPMIEFKEVDTPFPRDEYDYCILSSPTAAKFYARRAAEVKVGKHFTVGMKTAEALSKRLDIPLDEIAAPDEYYIDQLADLLYKSGLEGKTILSPGAETRIKDLDEFIASHGGLYDNVVLYRTGAVAYERGYVEAYIAKNAINAVSFFSPSAVNAFFAVAKLADGVKAFAVGKSTAKAIEKYAVQAFMPEKQTAESMAELLSAKSPSLAKGWMW